MVTGLVDTAILVDLLRGYPASQTWISTQTMLGITRVVHLELINGAKDKIHLQRVLKLLKQFDLVEMTNTDFNWATQQLIKFKLSHGMGIMDCLIVAPSHRLQLPLYTQNLKHMNPLLNSLAQKPY